MIDGDTAPPRARWGLARVRGDSMLPALRPSDLVLVRYRRRTPRPGQCVVARFADGTVVIKRVRDVRRREDGSPAYWLLSDNAAQGVDSRHRGAVPARDILGVVAFRLWPPVRGRGRTVGLFRGV